MNIWQRLHLPGPLRLKIAKSEHDLSSEDRFRGLARRRCHCQQAVDELTLPLQDLLARRLDRKPFSAVDFRKARPAAALGRPLQLECVRLERRRIEVALDREGRDNLTARLRNLTERPELATGTRSGLFLEFTHRDVERVLCFGIFALRDRPRAEVLPGPER